MSQIKGRGGLTVHCPDEVRYRLIREIVSEPSTLPKDNRYYLHHMYVEKI